MIRLSLAMLSLTACGDQLITPPDAAKGDARLSDNWADQDTNGVGTHRVTADVLNVRNASAQVIGSAQRDQMLVLSGATYTSGGYTYHEAVFKGGALDGTSGWVAGSYLSYAILEICGTSSAQLRTGSTLGTVLGTAPSGSTMYVTSGTVRNTGTYRYIQGSVNGTVGYVATEWLCAPGSAAPGSASDLADALLDLHAEGTAVLWDQTFGRFDGASPLDNIRDTAAGGPAQTSCYGGAPCDDVFLDEALLDGMYTLAEDYDYFVTAIAGASHSAGSLHYDGRAFDLDEINGVRIYGDSSLARSFMSACTSLGAIEVFGPSNDPYGHYDHIHCAW